ncbi:hypothetical protein DGWBC_1138 [Dehalogenimonas sp. WBC-2]|nr:hypothetical protein DGWBC_1138 [Dehalogenimonas sp. WBC-2]
MADKYSYKQSKKKKSQVRPVAAPNVETEAPVKLAASAQQHIESKQVAAKSVTAPQVDSRFGYSLNLKAELKRVGMIGGSLVVVLVAAALLLN